MLKVFDDMIADMEAYKKLNIFYQRRNCQEKLLQSKDLKIHH